MKQDQHITPKLIPRKQPEPFSNYSTLVSSTPTLYSKSTGVLRPHRTFHSKAEIPTCCLHPPVIEFESTNYHPCHQASDSEACLQASPHYKRNRSSSYSYTSVFDWERRFRGGKDGSKNTHERISLTRSSSLDCGKDAYQNIWTHSSFELGPALFVETVPENTTSLWDLVRTSSRAKSVSKGSAGHKKVDPDPGHKRKRGASFEVEKAGPAIPLTKKALKEHLKTTMSSNQMSGGDVCTRIVSLGRYLLTRIAQDPFTPQRNNGSYSLTSVTDSPAPPLSINSKPSQVTYNLRQHMEEHGIYRDKGKLKRPELACFRKTVLQVVNEGRESGVRDGSEVKFTRRLQWTADDNEATVLLKLLPCIIKDGRQVRAPVADNEQNNGEVPERSAQQDQTADNIYTHEDYEEVGLQFCADRQFSETYLPNAFNDQGFEATVAEKLAKDQGMKQAKPDRIYGLDLDQLPIPKTSMLRSETQKLISIVPNMKDAFFFFEGKASNGDLTRASEQACRVGTCLVFTQRRLLAWTGHEDVVGADDRTYVYSATMDSNCMYLWVHFAVVDILVNGTKDVNFYMERIYSKTYHEDDSLLRLRRVCHNILDWGVGARKWMLKKRYKSIIEYDGRLMRESALRSKKEAAAKVEAKRAKRRKKNDGVWVAAGASLTEERAPMSIRDGH